MSDKQAEKIIDLYTYTEGKWKNPRSSKENKPKDGTNGDWVVLRENKPTDSTEFVDIDSYYNFYNVVSPRVEIEFRTGNEPSGNNWTNVKNVMRVNGIVYDAIVVDNANNFLKKEEVIKDGNEYKKNGQVVKIGDAFAGGKINSFSPKPSSNNNNFFISATIEDTGFRTLTLELFDRTFTTIQEYLYKAISFSNKSETSYENVTQSNSNTSFDLEFVKMPAGTLNNIRIAFGYNENIDLLDSQGTYRWVSRSIMKDAAEIVAGQNKPDESESKAFNASGERFDISAPTVLSKYNKQSTIYNGFEEFYITGVQSQLTNTGIRYQITAVGNEKLKLNGYKFVQKYANIVGKPKSVLASLMHSFNYDSFNSSTNVADAKSLSNTMIKLVWNDARPLQEEKKVVAGEDGEYKITTSEEQQKTLANNKEDLATLNAQLVMNQNLLGCITTKAGEVDDGYYIAGTTTSLKSLYKNWKAECSHFDPSHETISVDRNSERALWLNCLAYSKEVESAGLISELNEGQRAFLSYFLRNYGKSRIIDSQDTNVNDIKKFDTSIVSKSLASYAAEELYDFSNHPAIDDIDKHYTLATSNVRKRDVALKIATLIKNYFTNHKINENGWAYCKEYGDFKKPHVKYNVDFIRLPKFLFDCLTSDSAQTMINWCFNKGKNESLSGLIHNGWTLANYSKSGKLGKIKTEQHRPINFSGDPELKNFIKLSDDYYNYLFKGEKQETCRFNAGLLEYCLKNSNVDINETKKTIDYIDDILVDTKDLHRIDPDNAYACLAYAVGYYFYTQKKQSFTIEKNEYNNVYLEIDEPTTFVECSEFPCPVVTPNDLIEEFMTVSNNQITGWYKSNGIDYFSIESGTDGYFDGDDLNTYRRDFRTRDQWLESMKGEVASNFAEDLYNLGEQFADALEQEARAVGATDDSNWFSANTEVQLKNIINLIKSSTAYKFEPLAPLLNDSKYKSSVFRNNNKLITAENYEKVLGVSGYSAAENAAISITNDIKNLTAAVKELQGIIGKQESELINDEITLTLGGPEALPKDGSENKKYFKTISQLLNEFCSACPPYCDYNAEQARLNEYKETNGANDSTYKTTSDENTAVYTDEYGNKQTYNIKGEAPTYSLTWDIIGYYLHGNNSVPIIGLYYKTPFKPSKLRMYKWGTGNPDQHAVKNLNINTSSEFALLSSAANTTISIGSAGEKIAIKGSSGKILSNITELGTDAVKTEYKNFSFGESPAYFKNVTVGDEQYKITDVMFQSINKGSITVLGDPSLRFAGDIQPYSWPIYIDITLQTEGNTWSDNGNGAIKSVLSGVYVVTKITHSLNNSGYTTTLEVMRYPGINDTINI